MNKQQVTIEIGGYVSCFHIIGDCFIPLINIQSMIIRNIHCKYCFLNFGDIVMTWTMKFEIKCTKELIVM